MQTCQAIELRDATGQRVSVRNGVTFALFIDRHVAEMGAELATTLDAAIGMFPPDALKWAVVSATSEQWKPFDAASLQRMRDSLAPPGARKRRMTGFRINDAGGDAPRYGFRLLDKDTDPDYRDSRTWLQVTLPISWIEKDRLETLYSFARGAIALLKPEYGYCSPALLTSDAGQPAAFAQLKGLAMRHPGYDVDMNVMTCLTIGPRVRGARWITLMGPALWAALAGRSGTPVEVPAGVECREVSGIRWLQAGALPELGDVNRGAGTPGLCAMARLLEPVTLFGEVDLLSYFAGFDEDFLRRWERRFLDQAP